MESETIYYLYCFNAKYPTDKITNYYFEHKQDAETARFLVYKTFDGKRISTTNYTPPVSTVVRIAFSQEKLNKTEYFANMQQFYDKVNSNNATASSKQTDCLSK